MAEADIGTVMVTFTATPAGTDACVKVRIGEVPGVTSAMLMVQAIAVLEQTFVELESASLGEGSIERHPAGVSSHEVGGESKRAARRRAARRRSSGAGGSTGRRGTPGRPVGA